MDRRRKQHDDQLVQNSDSWSAASPHRSPTTTDAVVISRSDPMKDADANPPQHQKKPAPSPTTHILPPGVHLYSESAVMDFNGAVGILMQNQLKASQVCTVVPQECPGRGATFVIDMTRLRDPRDIHVDSYGSWGKSSGGLAFYDEDTNHPDTLVRVEAGKPENPTLPFVILIRRNSYRHPCTNSNFRKAIFTAEDWMGNPWGWGIVAYSWDCEPFEFAVKPHGNATRNLDPYIRTKPSVKKRIKELCRELAPTDVARAVLEEDEEALPRSCILTRIRNMQGNIPLPVNKMLSMRRKRGRKRRPYFCEYCETGFIRRRAFHIHMRSVHGVEADLEDEAELSDTAHDAYETIMSRYIPPMDTIPIPHEGFSEDHLATVRESLLTQLNEIADLTATCEDLPLLDRLHELASSMHSLLADTTNGDELRESLLRAEVSSGQDEDFDADTRVVDANTGKEVKIWRRKSAAPPTPGKRRQEESEQVFAESRVPPKLRCGDRAVDYPAVDEEVVVKTSFHPRPLHHPTSTHARPSTSRKATNVVFVNVDGTPRKTL